MKNIIFRILVCIFTLALFIVPIMPVSHALATSTEILRPNAVGDVTQLTPTGDANGWGCVDEVVADAYTTYVLAGSSSKYDLYNLPAHTGTGTINYVKVYLVLRASGSEGDAKPKIKIGSVEYDGSNIDVSPYTWTTYSYQWNTNPGGGSWAWGDIDSLQVGVWLRYSVSYVVRCTQIYVEVNYTPPTIPTVTTQDAEVTSNTTATGNGNITSAGTLDIDEWGFDWDINSGIPYSNNATDSGNNTVGAYDKILTGLPAGTTIYYRAKAHNSLGWAYGSEYTFITFGSPSINSDVASNVAVSSARLNSMVVNGGGVSCNVSFGYGLVSKTEAQFATYDHITDWSIAEWETGEHPYYDASSLNITATYYYRVRITNSYGTAISTDEQSFTTFTNVGSIPNFYGYPSGESISLNWVLGSGDTNILIRYAMDTYPATTTNGTLVYFGSANTYNHTGLSIGTTYYYSAWGESGGSYSANATTLVMTTLITAGTGDSLPTPTAPTSWNQDIDETTLENLEPIYSIMNALIDDWGMDRGVGWMGFTLTICCGIGLVLYIKFKAPMLSLFVIMMLMIAGIWIKLLPSWMIFIVVIMGIGVWSLRREPI